MVRISSLDWSSSACDLAHPLRNEAGRNAIRPSNHELLQVDIGEVHERSRGRGEFDGHPRLTKDCRREHLIDKTDKRAQCYLEVDVMTILRLMERGNGDGDR
jgi:hypothetical protein